MVQKYMSLQMAPSAALRELSVSTRRCSIKDVAPQIKLRAVDIRCNTLRSSHDDDLPMSDMTPCEYLGQGQERTP
jgi:hypothetical protein